MIPIAGQPILTAARMRAAEDKAIAAGSSVEELMEHAGAGVAEAVRRLAAGAPVLVLCGPGNNGGDGYVAARVLKANGVEVRVAATGEPKSVAAIAARKAWTGAVAAIDAVEPEPIFVDALFGTGGSRPLDNMLIDRLARFTASRLSIAVDLPSGIDSDSGAELNPHAIHDYHLTLALGAIKPAHLLQPAADRCGEVRLIDIGLGLDDIPMTEVSADWTMRRPWVSPPSHWHHKYSRGVVIVVGGIMPGASALAALAATRAGAGYVMLMHDDAAPIVPHAIVDRRWSEEGLADALKGKRQAVIVVGPGLGRDDGARVKLDAAIGSDCPIVIDGDALGMLGDSDFEQFKHRRHPVVLTPHEGEFKTMFGDGEGSKIDRARRAACRANATVIFKGPDTVIARPDGTTTTALPGSAWLSTAGTGDVLAGAVGAMLTAVCLDGVAAAVWMHAEAARRLGGAFIADDLARELSAVRAAL